MHAWQGAAQQGIAGSMHHILAVTWACWALPCRVESGMTRPSVVPSAREGKYPSQCIDKLPRLDIEGWVPAAPVNVYVCATCMLLHLRAYAHALTSARMHALTTSLARLTTAAVTRLASSMTHMTGAGVPSSSTGGGIRTSGTCGPTKRRTR